MASPAVGRAAENTRRSCARLMNVHTIGSWRVPSDNAGEAVDHHDDKNVSSLDAEVLAASGCLGVELRDVHGGLDMCYARNGIHTDPCVYLY